MKGICACWYLIDLSAGSPNSESQPLKNNLQPHNPWKTQYGFWPQPHSITSAKHSTSALYSVSLVRSGQVRLFVLSHSPMEISYLDFYKLMILKKKGLSNRKRKRSPSGLVTIRLGGDEWLCIRHTEACLSVCVLTEPHHRVAHVYVQSHDTVPRPMQPIVILM